MTVRFTKTKVVLSGNCTVEEAEQIAEWLSGNPKGELHLAEVTHLHAATLQVIAAAANGIATAPDDPFCASLLTKLART
jgi:hypothetical protein